MDEEYDREQELGGAVMHEVYDWVESGITAIVCVILIFTFAGRLVGVVGESMLPTLHDQDRLIVTHMFYKPANGDIIVATKPNFRNEPIIKRVIAAGGQTVDINYEKGEVTVDGRALKEPYILEAMDPYIESDFDLPLTVPEGFVFLMGDNRNNSWDSRFEGVGLVDERYILGKVVFRLMPYSGIGVPE